MRALACSALCVLLACATSIKDIGEKIKEGEYIARVGTLISNTHVDDRFCFTILVDPTVFLAPEEIIREEREFALERQGSVREIAELERSRLKRNSRLARQLPIKLGKVLEEIERLPETFRRIINIQRPEVSLHVNVQAKMHQFDELMAQILLASREEYGESIKDASKRLAEHEDEHDDVIAPRLDYLIELYERYEERQQHQLERLREIEEERGVVDIANDAYLFSGCRSPESRANKDMHKKAFTFIKERNLTKSEKVSQGPEVSLIRRWLQLECLERSNGYGWYAPCGRHDEILISGASTNGISEESVYHAGEDDAVPETPWETVFSESRQSDIKTSFVLLYDHQRKFWTEYIVDDDSVAQELARDAAKNALPLLVRGARKAGGM
jgi:hypothetical protein